MTYAFNTKIIIFLQKTKIIFHEEKVNKRLMSDLEWFQINYLHLFAEILSKDYFHV